MHSSTKIRLSLTDIFMGAICLFPIATLLQDEGIINKLLFAFVLAVLLFRIVTGTMKRKTFFWLAILTVHYVYVVIKTDFPLDNLNLLFYFPFFMLYTYFMTDHSKRIMDWFATHKGFMEAVLYVWSGLVLFSAFLPSSYHIKEGGAYYFGSFCGNIFRLGPTAMFIQILALVYQRLFHKRWAIAFSILPMFCYFSGSSRTYLVIGLCIFVVSWFYFCKTRKGFWQSIVPITLGALAIASVASIGEKIMYTLDENNYGDFWFRITSSRSELWAEILAAWSKENTIHKLLGTSLNFSYDAAGLWAHNDFLEIACSFGLFGVLQYCLSMGDLLRRKGQERKMHVIVALCVFLVWFFNAFTNMHYTYFCAVLSFPFLVFAAKYQE